MKGRPYRKEGNEYVPCEAAEATFLKIALPGPISHRLLPITLPGQPPALHYWEWNGDTERPTLRPSILNDFRPHDALVCHSFITNGQVIFLSDCTHEFAGQTLDLLDLD